MIEFEIFQKDVVELFTYAIAREDKLQLYCYSRMETPSDIRKANLDNKCGSVACTAGYAPEVHPKRFRWRADGTKGAIPYSDDLGWSGMDIIFAYQGLDSNIAEHLEMRDVMLVDIFEANHTGQHLDGGDESLRNTDIEVATKRLEVIQEATSYDNLGRIIDYKYRRWF